MTTSRPLLAIAIPTYNRADHLARLLKHLAEELPALHADVVVHISDNASTDRTAEVVARFTSVFPDARVTRQESNLGPDENFCRLLDAVDAEFVWLVGDDDIPLPGALSAITALLMTVKPDSMYMNATWVRSDEVQRDSATTLPARPNVEMMPRAAFARRVHIWTTFISGWIIRTDLVAAHPTRRFTGTSLVQLGWVLGAVMLGERHLYVTTPMLRATAANSGGYSALSVFGTSYASITRKALEETPEGRTIAKGMIRRAAIGYLPGLIWGLRTGVAGQFAADRTSSGLAPDDVGGRVWLRCVLLPIGSAPVPVARLVLGGAKVVSRLWMLIDRLNVVVKRGPESHEQ